MFTTRSPDLQGGRFFLYCTVLFCYVLFVLRFVRSNWTRAEHERIREKQPADAKHVYVESSVVLENSGSERPFNSARRNPLAANE